MRCWSLSAFSIRDRSWEDASYEESSILMDLGGKANLGSETGAMQMYIRKWKRATGVDA